VSDLAADLNRFLANEPVLAGPYTRNCHFKNFVYRHRWPVLEAAAVMIVLIGALELGLRGLLGTDTAEVKLRRGLEDQAKTPGTKKLKTVTARIKLSMTLLADGQQEEAGRLLLVNLKIRCASDRDESPETLGAIHNVGFLQMEDGGLDEARALIHEGLAGRCKLLTT
jgi:hypothetical protein